MKANVSHFRSYFEKMKTCPYCGEKIQESARKCRFCGEWINVDKENTTLEESTSGIKKQNKRKTPLIISIIYLLIYILGSGDSVFIGRSTLLYIKSGLRTTFSQMEDVVSGLAIVLVIYLIIKFLVQKIRAGKINLNPEIGSKKSKNSLSESMESIQDHLKHKEYDKALDLIKHVKNQHHLSKETLKSVSELEENIIELNTKSL